MKLVFVYLALAFGGAVLAGHPIRKRNAVEETLADIRSSHNEYSFANKDHSGFIKAQDFVPEHILEYFNDNNINIYTVDESRFFVAKFCRSCPLVAAMMEWLTYPITTPGGVLVMQLPAPSVTRWWNAPRPHSQGKEWIGDVVWLKPNCINCVPIGTEDFPGVSATHPANATSFGNQTTTVYNNNTTMFSTTMGSNMTGGYRGTGSYAMSYVAMTSTKTIARNATAVVPTTTEYDTETTTFTNTRSNMTQGHTFSRNHTHSFPVFTITKVVPRKSKAAIPTTTPFIRPTQSFPNTRTTPSTKSKRTPSWEGEPYFPTLHVSTASAPTVTPVVLNAVLGCPTCVGGLRPTAFTRYITLSPDDTVPASIAKSSASQREPALNPRDTHAVRGALPGHPTLGVPSKSSASRSELSINPRDTHAVGGALPGHPTPGVPSSDYSVKRNAISARGNAVVEFPRGSRLAMVGFVAAAVGLL